jgi:aryl-alcohol dehydrogenase-like predicted oxidoreductase
MRAEPLDFVRLNYSAVDRPAERRLPPLATKRGIGVILARSR